MHAGKNMSIMITLKKTYCRKGRKTGGRCVWGTCLDGRKVLLSLSTAHSERYESGLEGLRNLLKRGLMTPVTLTTDGAAGLIKAVDVMWPRSLRMRCWFHKMQHLAAHVPPQAWPAFKALVVDRREAPSVEEGQRRCEQLVAPYEPSSRKPVGVSGTTSRRAAIIARCPPAPAVCADVESRCAGREEERRRTKVSPHLWDEQSLLQRVCAVLMRVSERWGKKQCSEFEPHQIRVVRQSLALDHPLVASDVVTRESQPRRSAASAR